MSGGRGGMAVLLVASLLACSHTPPEVVESRVQFKSGARAASAPKSAPPLASTAAAQTYTVVKGDTLYSIAFRYGLDFKTLAAVNGIRDPFTIYPGQKITLKSRGQPLATRSRPARPPASVAPAAAPPPATAPVSPPVAATSPARTVAPASQSASPAKPASPAPAARPESPATATPSSSVTRYVGGGHWQWPAQGSVVGRFSQAGVGPKGIAIAGNPGDSVRAARDGRVVYTGSSLVGYGQLVIVKHDEVYLSAYAHNSKVLVKEGESVKAGQKIAEMGSTGTDRTKLHFEVRRNGSPVDPLSVLPRT